jgi:hypothetical protein
MFGGKLSTANITPHSTTGIGRWPKKSFIARFKSFDIKTYSPILQLMNLILLCPGQFMEE